MMIRLGLLFSIITAVAPSVARPENRAQNICSEMPSWKAAPVDNFNPVAIAAENPSMAQCLH